MQYTVGILKGKAYVCSNGCPESMIDSKKVERFLQLNGWEIVNDLSQADLIVFYACGLTAAAEKGSLAFIEKFKRKMKPEARLVPWGCLSKINPQLLHQVYDGHLFDEKEASLFFEKITDAQIRYEDVDAYSLSSTKLKFLTVLKKNKRLILSNPLLVAFDILYHYLSTIVAPDTSRSFFYIKVSTGCLENCTYCAVRTSRGMPRSRPIENIVLDFKKGIEKGFKFFYLLGTDLGAYGHDLGYNLADLLREIAKEEGCYKVGIRNVNPFYLKQMITDLCETLKTGKIFHITCPVESGSNKILKLMGRKYSTKEFQECIGKIKRAAPGILIRTQIMVGFPMETDEDFYESVRLVDEIPFDFIEVYKFSKRPGTKAASMNGQIPDDIAEKRFRKLQLKVVYKVTMRKINKMATTWPGYVRNLNNVTFD